MYAHICGFEVEIDCGVADDEGAVGSQRRGPPSGCHCVRRVSRSLFGRATGTNTSRRVKEEGGAHRISHLVLDGDESLFST